MQRVQLAGLVFTFPLFCCFPGSPLACRFGDRQGGEPQWPEYFFLPALLLIFITVLNDGTMIAIGYDNAKASDRPAKARCVTCFLTLPQLLIGWEIGLLYSACTSVCMLARRLSQLHCSNVTHQWQQSNHCVQWNLMALFFVSTLMAIVITLASLVLLWACLDSSSGNSVFNAFDLPPIEFGKIVMVSYLQLTVSGFLTLFSARTGAICRAHELC